MRHEILHPAELNHSKYKTHNLAPPLLSIIEIAYQILKVLVHR